ncbi:unnamed protein product [Mesocestoides corti]|nr:unnamed protein product [Mesocestoides corti]
MICLGFVLPVLAIGAAAFLLTSIALYLFLTNWTVCYNGASTDGPDLLNCFNGSAGDLIAPLVRFMVATVEVTSLTPYLVACVAWLWPLAIVFLLPVAFVVFLYSTALMVQLFCLRGWLLRAFRGAGDAHFPTDELLRLVVAAVWEAHGRAFHGYEVVGMEKLPPGEGAFLVYYHGTLPLDAYYFIARHIIVRNR